MSTTTTTSERAALAPLPPCHTHKEHKHETVEVTPLKVVWKAVPLSPFITTAREFTTNQVNAFVKCRNEYVSRYNENVRPVNRSLQDFRQFLGATKRESPGTILGGVCLATALCSLPTGRFVMLRNVAFTGLITSWCLWPATTTGATVVASRKLRGDNEIDLAEIGQEEVSRPPIILA